MALVTHSKHDNIGLSDAPSIPPVPNPDKPKKGGYQFSHSEILSPPDAIRESFMIPATAGVRKSLDTPCMHWLLCSLAHYALYVGRTLLDLCLRLIMCRRTLFFSQPELA